MEIQIETQHFRCLCSRQDADSIGIFQDALETAYDRIYEAFQFHELVSGRYTFCLCPDVKSYITVTGKQKEEYQPWMVGCSDSEEKKITLLSPKGAEGCTPEYLQRVAVHELVHMLFDEATGISDNEEWISEGIAILIAGQTDLRYVSEEHYPLISQLSGEAFAENGGYDYAGIYVWYFIKQYGFAEFLKAYQNQSSLKQKITLGFERSAIRAYQAELSRLSLEK